MKYRLIIFLAIGTALSLRAQTGWFWQNPLPQGNTINAVQGAGGNRFYAAGKLGTILRSNDGGVTWQSLSSGVTANLNALCFFNADTGLAVGAENTVLRTRDGGASWTRLAMPDTATYYAVFGLDSQTIFVAGSRGMLFQSHDGGDNWVTRDSKTSSALYAIAYNGVDYIYAAGAAGTLVRCKDGGATWAAYSWPATGTTIRALAFPGNNIGLAVGDGGRIYRSQTKGDNWSLLTLISGSPILRALHFADASHGYLCGDAGTLAASSDAGLSWPAQSSGTTQNLLAISVAATGSGVTAGVNGTLFGTANSGSLWQNRQGAFTTANLRGICLVDMDVTLAVGDSSGKGMIFRTSDSGWNWTTQLRRVGVLFEDLCFVSTDSGFVVGAAATLMRTSDSGTTWSTITGLPATSTGVPVSGLSGIHFITHRVGTIVGAGGAILRTSDAGVSWVNQTNVNYGLPLQAVHFVSPDTGLAVGFLGTILRTVNGGAAWSKISSGTMETLNSVVFADPAIAVSVGAASTILRSTNQGASWTKVSIPGLPSTTLEQVTFPSSRVGYITGSGGVILRSEDGGASWRTLSSPTSNSLNAVFFADLHIGAIAGDNGTVLRTSDGGLPVELLVFSGRHDAVNGLVFLTWKTATETNNYGFHLERRSASEWESVAFIAGHGTTVDEQSYNYQDRPGLSNGSLEYRLRQMDLDGSSRLLPSISVTLTSPVKNFSLWQNYPNPFNAGTTFSFFMPQSGRACLTIYDMAGREAAAPLNRELSAGAHRIPWNAGALPSGLYIYRLRLGQQQLTGKMMLIR